jgi:hypothetical protein
VLSPYSFSPLFYHCITSRLLAAVVARWLMFPFLDHLPFSCTYILNQAVALCLRTCPKSLRGFLINTRSCTM